MPTSPPIEHLTPREREILALIGEGYSLPEIAQQLHRSVKTVETHRLTLGRKLKANNRVELARIAISTGLVKLDDQIPASPMRPVASDVSEDGAAGLLRDFQALDALTGLATNARYLRHVSCAITHVLDVAYAGVCQILTIKDELMSRTLYMSHHGEFADNFMYALRGTPCEDVFRKGEQVCMTGVVNAYPADKDLEVMSLDSYLGLRLDTEAGEPIGLLWLADTKPLVAPDRARALLGLIAQRVAGELHNSIDMIHELERLESREQIQQDLGLSDLLICRSNTRLDSLLNIFSDFSMNMPLAAVAFDNDLILHFINPAMNRLFGYADDELIGQSITRLFTEESVPQYTADHAHACETGETLLLKLQAQRRDGSLLPVNVARSGLFDEFGKVRGTIALIAPAPDDA